MDPGLQARIVTLILGMKSGDNYFLTFLTIWTNNILFFLNSFFFCLFFSVSDPDKRLQALWVVCNKLPKNNKTNLRSVQRKVKEGVDSSVA